MLLLFVLGGAAYMTLELIWRGRSHYSMGLAGGLCTVLLLGLFTANPMPLWAAFLCGGVIITSVEFLVGFIFNLRLKKNVWDYSGRRLQLYGQICLGYSLLWGILGTGLWGIAKLGLAMY